jgi:membrane fusion protein, multidrug efflux system
MTRTNRLFIFLAALAIAAAAGYMGFLYGRSGAGDSKAGAADNEQLASDKAAGPVAAVKVSPAIESTIDKTVVAYGTIVAAPEEIRAVSVQWGARVRRVLVAAGQSVKQGTPLAEVEPSPETALSLDEARSTRDLAAKTLAQAQERLQMKIGTNKDVLDAQQALDLANLRLESLEKRDIKTTTVESQQSGVVSKIDVQEGQTVEAGAAIVETVAEKDIVAHLGVEPADTAELQVAQTVRVQEINGRDADPFSGTVRTISSKVNPETRLVDVFVSLPPDVKPLLDTYVRGAIVTGSRQALVVPRQAVLPEGQEWKLFTVSEGAAVEHTVKTGTEQDGVIEIVEGIKPGDAVVTEGNYELEDKMAVEVEKAQ